MSDRIRLLDDLGAEIARVAADAESRSRAGWLERLTPSGSRGRALAIAAAMTVLLGGTAAAVPAARDALDSVAGSLAGWVGGDDADAPGRPLRPGDDAPPWFGDDPPGDARLLDEAGGVGLFVRRTDVDGAPSLQFGIGPGMIVGAGALADWHRRLSEQAVIVLPGPAAFGPRDLLDDRGRFALMGVTTRDVARIEVRYEEGPPLRHANGDGGFVVLADAWRPLRELIAYDASGRVRDRVDLRGRDRTYLCEREPGCPPGSP